MSKQINEFAINLPMTSVGSVATSPAVPPIDCTPAALPADVAPGEAKHIYVYADGIPQVNQDRDMSMIFMDLVLNVSITNPTTGTCSAYKVVKRLSMDKCKLACDAEVLTPYQVVGGEAEPEDEALVEAEMKAFYHAREVRRKAGIEESDGTKTAKVLISYDDKETDWEGKKQPPARATATLVIKNIKDKAHARHVFDVWHKGKYKNAKITRVMMES